MSKIVIIGGANAGKATIKRVLVKAGIVLNETDLNEITDQLITASNGAKSAIEDLANALVLAARNSHEIIKFEIKKMAYLDDYIYRPPMPPRKVGKKWQANYKFHK